MRRSRFELTDRLDKKVWEVAQDGAALTTKLWARRGTAPRGTTRQFDSEAAAYAEFMRLVDEREGQGYVLIESTDDAARSAFSDPESERLEGAIARAPDVVDAYLAYAEWLTQRGQPLGEFIAVQAALSDKPKDRTLLARQGALLDTHSTALLGELAGDDGLDTTWRWGFLMAVELGVEEPCRRDPVEALRALFRLPTAHFLRDLVLGDFGDEAQLTRDSEMNYGDVVAAMVRMPLPKTLRRLVIAPRRVKLDEVEIGDVSVLLPSFPLLEELALRGSDVVLGKIDLPELRTFSLTTRGLSPSLVRALKTARWPKLSSLAIDFGRVAGDADLTDLSVFLEGKGVPELANLALVGWPSSDELAELVASLASAKSLASFRTLDLSRGKLSAAGVKTLVKVAKKLPGLERLDLSRQPLTRESIVALREAFGKRVVVNEGDDDGDADHDDGGSEDDEESFDDAAD